MAPLRTVLIAVFLLPLVVRGDARCPGQLSMLTGGSIGPLAGVLPAQVSLYRHASGQLHPVVFQIDQRDSQGRYLLDTEQAVDTDDELLLVSNSAGSRLPADSPLLKAHSLTELAIDGDHGQGTGWLYASTGNQPEATAKQTPLIRYLPATDTVETGNYRLSFSSAVPFLVDSLNLRAAGSTDWSIDLIDRMKIRHHGKLFGSFSFRRAGEDYSSLVSGVKAGPLRIIRRTENRVRVLWKLESPAVYIDYLLSPDGFVMDTLIDIPFKPGLFFSDLETLTTVDWNPETASTGLSLSSLDDAIEVNITGSPTPASRAFDGYRNSGFRVHTAYGVLHTRLDIPESLPIHARLYLRDDLESVDPPEQFSGQFGNVGFSTTGWERVDSEPHHLEFSVCIEPSVIQAKKTPPKMGGV